jgi:hypothetical protein
LTHQPSTIASIVALSSRSGLSKLLDPTDDEETIRAKLDSLEFSLDPETGAIIASVRPNRQEDALIHSPELETHDSESAAEYGNEGE